MKDKISASQLVNRLAVNYTNLKEFSNIEVDDDFSPNLDNGQIYKFTHSVFKSIVSLNVYSSPKTLDFTNTVFEDQVNITCNYSCTLIFNHATFRKALLIKAPSHVNISLSFEKANTNGIVEISNLILSNCNFKEFNFVDSEVEHEFIFENNRVDGGIFFDGAILHNAKFNKTIFNQNAKFDNCSFKYTTAPGAGNFFDVKFLKDAYFNNVDFDKGAFFNGSEFHGSALFVGVNKKGETIGDFSGVTFEKRSFFDHSKFKNIAFNNCEFTDIASFKNFKAETLEISKALFLKGADFLNSNIENADRETFRIIKNEFLKINNQVEALHYRSKEMKAYQKELSFKNNTGEYLLLLLNKLSNNHGLSWVRGICFTLLIAIVFFFFYLCSLANLPFQFGWINFTDFIHASNIAIKYFLKFLLVTHEFDFMKEFNPSAISYFLDFIAKIFIGYGIYQTIQAFRKFGKN